MPHKYWKYAWTDYRGAEGYREMRAEYQLQRDRNDGKEEVESESW